MSKQKILIIEDEENIANLLAYNLDKADFKCAISSNGEDALARLKKDFFDFIILDIMLPKIDGLEVCRQIKKDDKLSHIPILMLTAKGEEIDRIVGFELGVADYVVKPFSPRELVLRVKAILKRSEALEDKKQKFVIDKLTVDILSHKVFIGKKEIELTPIEFKLLTLLIERKGRAQSRELLLSDVWGISSEVETRTVDTHITRLREKLEDMGELIETVRGVGYRFAKKE